MLEDLKPNSSNRYMCGVERLRLELDESDQKILLDAVMDYKTWSVNGLTSALRAKGLKITDKPIKRHRDRLCNCFEADNE